MNNSGSRSAKTRDGRLVNFQVFDWSFNTNLKLLFDENNFLDIPSQNTLETQFEFNNE